MDKKIGGSCSIQPRYLILRENPSKSESSFPNLVAEKQDVVRRNQNQTSSNSMNSAGEEETTKRGKGQRGVTAGPLGKELLKKMLILVSIKWWTHL